MGFFRKKKKKNSHKVKKGDSQTFISLYDKYASPIYRFIYLRTNSFQDSEDLTSEVFLRFWRVLNRDTEQEQKGYSLAKNSNPAVIINNPRALLYQIARNLVIDFYRKKAQKELIISEDKEDIFKNIPDSINLKEKAILTSDINQIKKGLAKIKDEYQELLIWRYLDDFSVKEIAQIMEIPEGRVRVKVHRALKSLRAALGQPSLESRAALKIRGLP